MESDIGNIRALREWTRRYFYTKQDINFFMTKLNQGLKGYALMFIGPRNKKVTINPGNYEFTLNSDGWYRYLFFFERNQEITIAVQDGETITYQLDEYNDTINLSPYINAVPKKSASDYYWTPSGYLTPQSNVQIYNIFDRNSSTNWYGRTGDNYNWFQYEFPEKTYIYKVDVDLYTYKNNNNDPNTEYNIKLLGSYNNVNWDTLAINTYNQPISRQIISLIIDDPKDYIFYKWIIEKADGENNTKEICLYIYDVYFYTVDQSVVNYQIAAPAMSANSQYGCVCSAANSNADPWKAFDQDSGSDFWFSYSSLASNPDTWVQFKFPNGQGKVVRKLQVWTGGNGYSYPRTTKFKFLGSLDGTNFTEIGEFSFRHNEFRYQQIFYVNNLNAYIYYRFLITNTTDNSAGRAGLKVNMYEEV